MTECSFCGSKEEKVTPVCQSCGSLRYPVENTDSSNAFSQHSKLKLSAIIAAAAVTPGSFVVMALVGAAHLNNKFKNRH